MGLNGSNAFSKLANENNGINKNYNNLFNSDLYSRYYSLKNSAHYQGVKSYSLRFRANGSNSKTDTDYENNTALSSSNKSNSQGLELAAHSINRFYNNNKRFFEVDLDFKGVFGNEVRKNETDEEFFPFLFKEKNKDYHASVSMPLLVGTGRIEEVANARLAVYILDDLQKAGDLTKPYNNEEVLAFARAITQIKNQRFFDSRIRKIDEITAIDSFLIVNGLKAKSNASYYTLLYDNWDNSAGPSRSAGNRFSIGLVPGLSASFYESITYYRDFMSGSSNEITYKYNIQDNSFGLDAVAYYVCEKPLNLYWQQSTLVNLGYSLFESKILSKQYTDEVLYSDHKEILHSPNLGLGISHGYGYFPNSRTSITFGADAGIRQYWNDRKIDDDPNLKINTIDFYGNLKLALYYYFSPQLRLSVNIQESYLYSSDNNKGNSLNESSTIKTNYFESNFDARFTYSLF